VALMPYKEHEPTFSGSATRLYEHLAATRPILSSPGFHELLSKEPLLKMVETAHEFAAAVESLRKTAFRDGYEELRGKDEPSEYLGDESSRLAGGHYSERHNESCLRRHRHKIPAACKIKQRNFTHSISRVQP
jgi:hypothetical protein